MRCARIACRKQVDWTRVNPLPRPVPARPLLLVVDDEIPVLKAIERVAANVIAVEIDDESARMSARRSLT
jgi:hypothetical protein